MSSRSLCGLLGLLSCWLFSGCYPPAEGTLSEEKNPYFLEGKGRIGTRDYPGAIAAFEKALEDNPRSGRAHFELGVLYEQNSQQTEADYINAMYHYQQAMRLRPNVYPYDNARLRMASCKRELIKAESLAPVYQSMQRELEKLRDENQQLRKQLEFWQASLSNRVAALPGSPSRQLQFPSPSPARAPQMPPATNSPARTLATNTLPAFTPVVSASQGPPPAPPPARTHLVKSRETLHSIARQYRLRVEDLMAVNPGLEPKRLRAGQTVRLPGP